MMMPRTAMLRASDVLPLLLLFISYQLDFDPGWLASWHYLPVYVWYHFYLFI
jgi:hypothetical protein